jgi:hypothetical protein
MSRLRRLNPSIPVLGILLALTAILRLLNVMGSPARLDDEGTYVAQAYAVTQWGELAHYTYWYDHPPAGWLQLAAWTAITGPELGGNAVAAGRYLMVIVAVITAGLLWFLARRTGLSRWASVIAVVIYAASPLSISLSRTVYLDNLAIAWLMAALVLICSPRHRLSAMFGAATCFGVAVLTKETMLLFVPMVVWLVWTKTVPATRRYALAVFATVFAMVVSTYILMAVVRGELVPGPGHVSLWQGIKFQLWERAGGGAITDPGSLKRHTLTEWLQLDLALPILAVPIALAGLLVERLRPFAVGLATLIAIIVRPGYLPVPLIISALPLTALLAAGTGEVALRYLLQSEPAARLHRFRGPALSAGVLVISIVVSLWLPTFHAVLHTDDDASMQQAQQWISQNVPKGDRLIADDAIWVDLIREGRERRDVVWAYKVDTDEQVRAWAPKGWASYDWIVSTPSTRANVPKAGVLTDAIAHAQPAATFGSGGTRVDVLRVDNFSPKPVMPAAPAFGTQLAARLTDSANPDALGVLQSRTVDQRVLAALAVISATEPVRLEAIPAMDGEQIAGTPRREVILTGPRKQLNDLAAFFERQAGPFAVESAAVTSRGLEVRFPLRTKDIGLSAGGGPPQGDPAALRVADMRRGQPAEQVDLVRIDGTSAGSLSATPDANPSAYHSVPAGTYVVTTHADGHTPVIRQVLTLDPAAPYTLTLFTGAESGDVTAELAPDGPPAGPPGKSAVRLVNAASAQGSVKLELTPATGGDPIVLANDAGYGLITGYAPLPGGQYTAVVTANGKQWQQPVDLIGGEPTSFLLTDGTDGPALGPLRDVPDAPATLNPPALTMPSAGTVPPAPAEKMHAIARVDQSTIPAVAGVCVAALIVALLLIRVLAALARRRQGSR